MNAKQFSAIIFSLLGLIIIASLWKVDAISGFVYSSNGDPIEGASVRIKTTGFETLTDTSGHFDLTGFPPSSKIHVTAWKDGYYVEGDEVKAWDPSIEIFLSSYNMPDNNEYSWILPVIESRSPLRDVLTNSLLGIAEKISFNKIFLPLSGRMVLGCNDCHGKTIYDQWAAGAHSFGVENPRFMSMYEGTDIKGDRSPETEYVFHRDYGKIPLLPDDDEAYYGPGYKLDFPDSSGNCAACHLPTSAIEDPYGVDPREVKGVDAKGSHCDFCHKIVSVNLDPSTGGPYENMPGIMSMELMRPSEDDQVFFGPYDDVDVGPDTFLPLQKQSEICAPCHAASFWGVPIYQSFTEWLESPYPGEGKTCQSCHMKPDGITTNFAPGRGGVERDPFSIPTHDFPGASDEELLKNTADLVMTAVREDDEIIVIVNITNSEGGHHIPTDSPLRQIFLVVKVTDEKGRPLPLQEGPTLPEWAGDLEGRVGVYYAKILEQMWTEVSPTGAYWTQTKIVEDTRIPARETHTSFYVFSDPGNGEINVEVQLIFRRAYYDLMQQKGWDTPDILMENATVTL